MATEKQQRMSILWKHINLYGLLLCIVCYLFYVVYSFFYFTRRVMTDWSAPFNFHALFFSPCLALAFAIVFFFGCCLVLMGLIMYYIIILHHIVCHSFLFCQTAEQYWIHGRMGRTARPNVVKELRISFIMVCRCTSLFGGAFFSLFAMSKMREWFLVVFFFGSPYKRNQVIFVLNLWTHIHTRIHKNKHIHGHANPKNTKLGHGRRESKITRERERVEYVFPVILFCCCCHFQCNVFMWCSDYLYYTDGFYLLLSYFCS